MPIQAITFDFWSTLYHYIESPRVRQRQEIQKMLLAYGHQYPEQQVTDAMKKAWQIWDDIWRTDHYTPEADAWLGFVIENLNVDLPKSVLEETASILEKSVLTDATQPVDGVPEILKKLSTKYRLGIISDTGLGKGNVLRTLLERDSLLSYFSHFTFSDEFGRSKPHADVFSATLKGLNVKSHQAIHIGDLRHTDIAGAQKVGMSSIRFAGIRDDKDENYPEANLIIYNYNELEEALNKLEIMPSGARNDATPQ